MNKSLNLALLSVLSLSAQAELCIDNETGLSENFFSYQYIKNPVIDRSNPKRPVLTSPQELIQIRRLGDHEYQCVNVSDFEQGRIGYLAIMADAEPLNNTDNHFYMTKNEIIATDNKTTIVRVHASEKGKVTVIMGGDRTPGSNWTKWKKVPVELIFGLGKSNY